VDELMARAFTLSEQRLKADPKDVQALYTRGITRGMRATYLALVDKAWLAALRSALAARRDHEKVLEMAPDFADAKTIVGAHYYVTANLPWAIKVAASVLGVSGNKQKGLQYLYAAAEGGGETAPDAKITLCLFLRREQRFDDALKLIRTLTAAYPRNSLFAIEEGNILNAGGHGMDAIAVFRAVLEKGKKGFYKDPHLELAAFTLGEALRGQKLYKEAAEAYEMVRSFPHRDPELLQKADLAAGQMHDLQQERPQALADYNAVVAADRSSPEAEQARRFLRQPYRASSP
jgi:tetratricopeptide (TPR) repeat protein